MRFQTNTLTQRLFSGRIDFTESHRDVILVNSPTIAGSATGDARLRNPPRAEKEYRTGEHRTAEEEKTKEE